MNTRLIAALLICLAAVALVFPNFERARREVSQVELKELTLPPFVSRFLALEFRSVAADYLFAQVIQFYGGRVQAGETFTPADWMWLYSNLQVVTDLDPYFEDPYYFGNAVLTWNGRLYNQANRLLQKGAVARTWDWQFPFYIGFNSFYFLNDNKGGADYFLMAAKRPGASPYLPALAARLYKNEGKTALAISVLTDFLESERDPKTRKSFEIRLEALKKILALEQAVGLFRKKTGRAPRDLQALVEKGLITEIPTDPYGGRFYVDKNGSIMTTSNLAFKSGPQQQMQK